MTSTSVPAVAPIPALAEKRFPARPSPAGFLARHPAFGLGLFLLGGLIFGILAVNVLTNGPLLAWDLPIDQALHSYATHNAWLGFDVMRFSGSLGSWTALAIAVPLMLYWFWKRQWYEISMVIIGVNGGNLWFVVLSRLFGRHRPIFPDPLNKPLPGPGFPSGHSILVVLLYGLFLYLLLPRLPSWRWRFLAILDATLLILLVGFSRLYMGDHFPTDVLGGYSFGLAWGALVYTSIELYRQHRSTRPKPRIMSKAEVPAK